MNIKELHILLKEAYTVSNLNKISLTLINLYRDQQYTILQKIAEIISDSISIVISDDGKGFSRLIMLYHPDRAGYHLKEINRYAEQENFDGLLEYAHILKLERIEEIALSLNSYEDIDYSPVYDWDQEELETEGFTIIEDIRPAEIIRSESNTDLAGYTYYDAIKIREYGNTDIEYPVYYLEDIDEFELSSSDITDLDGVQFCIHAKTIDLSNNRISDLTPLLGLKGLEELNLSDNEIGYLDILGCLPNLRNLKLANNFIEDVAPLLDLKKLEYADLSGNNIASEQIGLLVEKGVAVDF